MGSLACPGAGLHFGGSVDIYLIPGLHKIKTRVRAHKNSTLASKQPLRGSVNKSDNPYYRITTRIRNHKAGSCMEADSKKPDTGKSTGNDPEP